MPMPITVSTCAPQTEQGKHLFEIFGYNELRGAGLRECIRSGTFSVGGHDWALIIFPDGYNYPDDICFYLEHLTKDVSVRASCNLNLVDTTSGLSSSLFVSAGLELLKPNGRSWLGRSMKRIEFEALPHFRDDHLTIECIVTVKRPRVSATQFSNKIETFPSNITENLAKLLDEDETADVTFSVEGETIMAHKILLAVRSPVFRAELCGAMREAKAQHVTIDDMQPAVFRALLHFIYTDSLPDTGDDHGGKSNTDLTCHLLVAADRYAVDRLKLLCESILSKNLDVENVSTTMALAYQHSCDRLKDICFEFINSSGVMDAVMATDGYKELKTTCPYAFIDMFEKTTRFRKT
ncbi:hypothetical protein U9M48_040361 [Paspalum notatum var. saurae]|uniref:Uncharacterized protein n=1 Tax=Paspalum notatum var. saurae TaxID=547442 RepID=A0AAQ3UMQ0_PASNO